MKNNKIYITRDEKIKEFNDFTRFESELHSIKGSLTKYEQKSGIFNPIIGEKRYKNNLVAKGDNVWVFRGDTPDLCKIFGKKQEWCISSSSSISTWFNYRMNYYQTQYFVFDFNKDENDPARYVNPGVAPEGMRSEWVDAENEHDQDPEDENSDVGINGYKSINEYKKYLVSKGIPESIWTTTEPEEWEERLKGYTTYYYNHREDFNKAKNDPDPRVFPMYLKIVDKMADEDFNTLTDDQKKEFVLGKLDELTDQQLLFAMKTSGYYNSINSELSSSYLLNKIMYGKKLIKDDFFKFVIKNKLDLTDDFFHSFFFNANNKYELIMYAIQNKQYLTLDNIDAILWNSQPEEKYEIIKAIIERFPNLNDNNFAKLIIGAYGMGDESVKIYKLLIDKKEKLSTNNIEKLISNTSHAHEIIKYIINKEPDLTPNNIDLFLGSSEPEEKLEIIKAIIEKLPNLNDEIFEKLIIAAYVMKVEISEIYKLLVDKKEKLSMSNIDFLIANPLNKYEVIKYIIEKEKVKLDLGMAVNFTSRDMDEKHRKEIADLIVEKNPKLKDKYDYILNFNYK